MKLSTTLQQLFLDVTLKTICSNKLRRLNENLFYYFKY